MLNDWSHKVRAILKEYCPGNIKKILPASQSAWNTRFYFGHQKLCMDNNKKYCPPCHKARGIHDFILATKSSVWIIIIMILTVLSNDFVTRLLHIPRVAVDKSKQNRSMFDQSNYFCINQSYIELPQTPHVHWQ